MVVYVKITTTTASSIVIGLTYPNAPNTVSLTDTLKPGSICAGALDVKFDPYSTNSLGSTTDCSTNQVTAKPYGVGALVPAGTYNQQGYFAGYSSMSSPSFATFSLSLTASATTTFTISSWSIEFHYQCVTTVPNSLNVATLATYFQSSTTVTCATGYTAVNSPLTCSVTTGSTAAACSYGGSGGQVITWGLNANPYSAALSSSAFNALITIDNLARQIPFNRIRRYDSNLNYAWLPNGVIATRVALSDFATFVLSSGGAVYMWGQYFVPGDKADDVRVWAQQIQFPSGTLIAQIYATASTVAALAGGNALYMWGDNTFGQCGFSLPTYTFTPKLVENLPGSSIVDVTVGPGQTAIITPDGSIYMWGYNGYFNLGYTYDTSLSGFTGSNITTYQPTKVYNVPQNAQAVDMSWYQTCALMKDGTLWLWGIKSSAVNFYLWSTSVQYYNVPITVSTGTGNKIAITATAATTAPSLNPVLSTNTPAGDFVRQLWDTTNKYVAISAYDNAFAALRTDRKVYTWGYDVFPLMNGATSGSATGSLQTPYHTGVLGRSVSGNYDDTIAIVNGITGLVFEISMGSSFGLALDADLNVWQWGSTFTDDLTISVSTSPQTTGVWTTTSRAYASKVTPSFDNVSSVVAGRDHAAALNLEPGLYGCSITTSVLTSTDVGYIPGLSSASRAALVANIGTMSICKQSQWNQHFSPIDPVQSPSWELTMPASTNGVTITITNWGTTYYVVITTFAPNGLSQRALGITPLPDRAMLWLFQVEQMYPDGSMSSSNPIEAQVKNAVDTAIVYVYKNAYRTGQALAGEHGWWISGNPLTLHLNHTSAIAGYGAGYTSGSNDALLGLIALIFLPILCFFGTIFYIWHRHRSTPALVQAASVIDPNAVPMFLVDEKPIAAPTPAGQVVVMVPDDMQVAPGMGFPAQAPGMGFPTPGGYPAMPML